jgi:small subunit ribosomal protein S8
LISGKGNETMMTDPIADFLARLRNGLMAKHKTVSLPSSKMKARMAQILKDEGYISDCTVEEATTGHNILKVTLKYDDANQPLIEGLVRVSKPGLRAYAGAQDLPKVRGGIGMSIVSTSRGLMTDHQARRDRVGGEVLCHVW